MLAQERTRPNDRAGHDGEVCSGGKWFTTLQRRKKRLAAAASEQTSARPRHRPGASRKRSGNIAVRLPTASGLERTVCVMCRHLTNSGATTRESYYRPEVRAVQGGDRVGRSVMRSRPMTAKL
jgi:hypothetical protein